MADVRSAWRFRRVSPASGQANFHNEPPALRPPKVPLKVPFLVEFDGL